MALTIVGSTYIGSRDNSTWYEVDGVVAAEDGLDFYVNNLGISDREIEQHQITAGTPWDINSTSLVYTLTHANIDFSGRIRMSRGGDRLFYSTNGGTIGWFDLTTPFDLSTAVPMSGAGYQPGFSWALGMPFCFADLGFTLYILDSNGVIYTKYLSAAWDLESTITDGPTKNIKTLSGSFNIMDFHVVDSGKTLFAASIAPYGIAEFNFSTPYDVSTITYNTTVDPAGAGNQIIGLFVGQETGELLYVDGDGIEGLHRVTLAGTPEPEPYTIPDPVDPQEYIDTATAQELASDITTGLGVVISTDTVGAATTYQVGAAGSRDERIFPPLTNLPSYPPDRPYGWQTSSEWGMAAWNFPSGDLVPGVLGNAFALNTLSSILLNPDDIVNSDPFEITHSAISFWLLFPSSPGTSYQYILANANETGNASIRLRRSPAGYLELALESGGTFYSSTNPYADDRIYRVTVIFEDGVGAQLYVNDVLEIDIDAPGVPLISDQYHFAPGTGAPQSATIFPGAVLEDIWIFRAPIGIDQIGLLSSSDRPTVESYGNEALENYESLGGTAFYDEPKIIGGTFSPLTGLVEQSAGIMSVVLDDSTAVLYGKKFAMSIGPFTLDPVSFSHVPVSTAIDAVIPGETIASLTGKNALESLSLSDRYNLDVFINDLAADNISLKSFNIVAAFLNRVSVEGFYLGGDCRISFDKHLKEIVYLLPNIDIDKQIIKYILDGVNFSEVSASSGVLVNNLSVYLSLISYVYGGKGGELSETVSFEDTFLLNVFYYERLIEEAVMEDLSELTALIKVSFSESFNAVDTLDTNAVLQNLVSEGISFRLSFNTGDATYTGWAMNTKTFAVSEYDSYPFNSFAKIGGKYYGANDNGLYLLEGSDDAGIPIDARVRLGETNFGKSVNKRLDSVYLGFRADGSMVLKTVTEGNIERWYKVTGDTEKLHRQRVHPLAKGVKAVWWEFELTNVDGADFEVSEIEFVPIMLSRSV